MLELRWELCGKQVTSFCPRPNPAMILPRFARLGRARRPSSIIRIAAVQPSKASDRWRNREFSGLRVI
jgi:hypothetical protein